MCPHRRTHAADCHSAIKLNQLYLLGPLPAGFSLNARVAARVLHGRRHSRRREVLNAIEQLQATASTPCAPHQCGIEPDSLLRGAVATSRAAEFIVAPL